MDSVDNGTAAHTCGGSLDADDKSPESPAVGNQLDELEQSLLRLLCSDQTIREIAKVVGYSKRQVERRVQALYVKLGVGTRHAAAFEAGRLGIIEMPDDPK
ncbi:MAG: hypothetical protein P1T08_04915 [Acidimicrobiia bacterium]|nr:hypothetical protein [Acidimicrobiia bacterium]